MAEESTEQVTEPSVRSLGNFESAEYKAAKGQTSTEAPPVTTTPPIQEQSVPPAPETPQTTETQTSEMTDEQYWKSFSDQVGFQVTSEEDVQTHLKSKLALEKELENERKKYGSLSPLAIDLDRAEKAGMDHSLYLEARNLQVEKLDDLDVIKRKYTLEHADMFKQSPGFAKMEFERYYKAKYGILSEQMDDIQREERAEEIEYATQAHKFESGQSRKFLAEWQTKNVTIPEALAQQGPSQEEQTKIREQYLTQASAFVDELDVLQVPVGDSVFKYGLSDHINDIRHDISNPLDTLKRFGLDFETGTIDANLFGELVVKLYALEHIGKPLADWHLEQSNAQTVKQRLDGPAPTQPLSGGVTPEKTHDQKVGEAFQVLHASR